MSLVEIFRFIFKRKIAIFGTFILVVTLSTTLLYLIAPVYGARASVLVERNRAPNMRTELQPGLEMIEVINTEAHLAVSESVLTAAVDEVKPHEVTGTPSAFKQWAENLRLNMHQIGLFTYLPPRERWIRRLSKVVESEPVPNSNVLELTYFDEDPERAARIVNAIVDAYLDARTEIYRASGEIEIYRSQIDDVTARIAARRGELDKLRAAIDENRSEVGARTLDLRLGSINEELSTVRVELNDLKERFQPEHPRVKATEKRIEVLQAELEETLDRMEQETLLTARTDQLNMLIEADTNTFKNLKERLDDAELAEYADRQLLNVRKVDVATPPNKPRFERLLLIILSIPLGLFMGFALAFIREYFDDSVESLQEAEEALDIPGYGTIGRFGPFRSILR